RWRVPRGATRVRAPERLLRGDSRVQGAQGRHSFRLVRVDGERPELDPAPVGYVHFRRSEQSPTQRSAAAFEEGDAHIWARILPEAPGRDRPNVTARATVTMNRGSGILFLTVLHDTEEGLGLQRRPAYQHPVHVGLDHDAGGIAGVDAAAVKDADGLR